MKVLVLQVKWSESAKSEVSLQRLCTTDRASDQYESLWDIRLLKKSVWTGLGQNWCVISFKATLGHFSRLNALLQNHKGLLCLTLYFINIRYMDNCVYLERCALSRWLAATQSYIRLWTVVYLWKSGYKATYIYYWLQGFMVEAVIQSQLCNLNK